MKKLILHALCALTLCAGMPAHAMYDRVKSYMPSVPKMSMSSVDYKTAVKRFAIEKQRFEKALKSNKKAVITTAAVALLAAIGMVLRARQQDAQAAAASQGAPASGPRGSGDDGSSSSSGSEEERYPLDEGGYTDDDPDGARGEAFSAAPSINPYTGLPYDSSGQRVSARHFDPQQGLQSAPMVIPSFAGRGSGSSGHSSSDYSSSSDSESSSDDEGYSTAASDSDGD